MLSLRTYYLRNLGFLIVIGSIVGLVYQPLRSAFQNNISINSVIVAALFIGVVLCFVNLNRLRKDIAWLEAYDEGKDHLPNTPAPRILTPLAILLRENTSVTTLPGAVVRSALNSIDHRLEESRDFPRYLMGVLIFLGLLGTFWGLSQTISALVEVIRGLDMGGGNTDVTRAFQDLKSGLQAPLTGMGTAFSCSLLGLSGSLIIGFLDAQYGKACAAFFHHIEERLAMVTRMTGDGGDTATHHGTAYSLGLLEQAAEGMGQLSRLLKRGEENRTDVIKGVQTLADKVEDLTHHLQHNHLLLQKIAEHQLFLQDSLGKVVSVFGAATPSQEDDFRHSLKRLEGTTQRVLEEMIEGRTQLTTDMCNEIRLVARTISALGEGQDEAAA